MNAWLPGYFTRGFHDAILALGFVQTAWQIGNVRGRDKAAQLAKMDDQPPAIGRRHLGVYRLVRVSGRTTG